MLKQSPASSFNYRRCHRRFRFTSVSMAASACSRFGYSLRALPAQKSRREWEILEVQLQGKRLNNYIGEMIFCMQQRHWLRHWGISPVVTIHRLGRGTSWAPVQQSAPIWAAPMMEVFKTVLYHRVTHLPSLRLWREAYNEVFILWVHAKHASIALIGWDSAHLNIRSWGSVTPVLRQNYW